MKAGKNRQFLGYRAVVSTNPLKYAPTFTWYTYGDIDLRRRYIGSALHSLFQRGELGGGEFQSVGIWAPNCPGKCYLYWPSTFLMINSQSGKLLILHSKATKRSPSACMIHLAKILSVRIGLPKLKCGSFSHWQNTCIVASV